jgi:hypothetical protein
MIALNLAEVRNAPCNMMDFHSPSSTCSYYVIEVVCWIEGRVATVFRMPRVGRARGNCRSVFAVGPFNVLDFPHEVFQNHKARIAPHSTAVFFEIRVSQMRKILDRATYLVTRPPCEPKGCSRWSHHCVLRRLMLVRSVSRLQSFATKSVV